MDGDERSLAMPPDAWQRLETAATGLDLAWDEVLRRLCLDTALLDRVAATLAVPPKAKPVRVLVGPERMLNPEFARLAIDGERVWSVLPHADERFSGVCRALSFRWGGRSWERTVDKFSGPVLDRAIELGVHLLAAGFGLELYSEELQRRIAAGDYRPEQRRWVKARTAGKYAGWFCIAWESGGDFRARARLLSGSRVYADAALVPAAAFDEVLDFARLHGFPLSNGALDLAERARGEREAMLLARPVVRQASEPAPALPQAVDLGEVEIADELADEPL